ncbi:hypothetical protein [Priestia flexa]|uniref:hypothetical protein n=1 Tax=Priestia flexa TaxID=86664 RepID=UPI000A8EEEFD|nr:hypothetical protein [Priestia flexa]
MEHALEILKREKRLLEKKIPMISFLPTTVKDYDERLNSLDEAIATLEKVNT